VQEYREYEWKDSNSFRFERAWIIRPQHQADERRRLVRVLIAIELAMESYESQSIQDIELRFSLSLDIPIECGSHQHGREENPIREA
jgi:hypothetical protein